MAEPYDLNIIPLQYIPISTDVNKDLDGGVIRFHLFDVRIGELGSPFESKRPMSVS